MIEYKNLNCNWILKA